MSLALPLTKPCFLSPGLSPFRVQHMDLSNSVIEVSALLGLLSQCFKLQNLSLEGLQLSDAVIR